MASDNTSFMIVFALILLLSLYYLFGSGPIHNEGALQTNLQQSNSTKYSDSESQYDDSSLLSEDSNDSSDSGETQTTNNSSVLQAINDNDIDDSVDSSLEIINERAMGQNGPFFRKKNGGNYVHNSYRSVGAYNSSKNVDKQFKIPDIVKNQTDKYMPMDESDGQGAPVNIVNNKGTEKDKYAIDSYLPQEKEKDWFETIETVDVKNSHLINIYRPIGVNTIGSTHKNSTYDIRGTDKAVCPKFVVSPWLQSSIEPDRSMKSLC